MTAALTYIDIKSASWMCGEVSIDSIRLQPLMHIGIYLIPTRCHSKNFLKKAEIHLAIWKSKMAEKEKKRMLQYR